MSEQLFIKQFSLVLVEFQYKKTVPFQIIQLGISTQFKCKYGLIVKDISKFSICTQFKSKYTV